MQKTSERPSGLVKPGVDTKFHIDYSWWDRSDEDLRLYILSHLPPEQRDALTADVKEQLVDYIDPETGEVFQVDSLGMAIQVASRDPNYITSQTPLVDSIFRVFLANGNTPLSARELEVRTGRPAATILKMLSGSRVWKGIRPVQSES